MPYSIESGAIASDAQRAIDHWSHTLGGNLTFRRKRLSDLTYLSISRQADGPSIANFDLGGGIQQIRINLERARDLFRNNGAATVSIQGVIVHEIGHALGLLHEHQRPDRDRHIDVPENIPQRRQNDFRVREDGQRVNYYDIESVMHYMKSQGGVNISHKEDPDRQFEGQIRGTLSLGDVAAIMFLYPIPQRRSSRTRTSGSRVWRPVGIYGEGRIPGPYREQTDERRQNPT